MSILRIPMDLEGIRQFEKPGFEGERVYGIRMAGRTYAVAVKVLPEPASFTMPPEPGRTPEEYEVADLVWRMFNGLTACVGRGVKTRKCQLPSAECRVPSAECRVPSAECRVPSDQ